MPVSGLQTVVCRAVVRKHGRAARGGGGDASLVPRNQWGRGGWRRRRLLAARLWWLNAVSGPIFEMGLERRAGAAPAGTHPFAAPTTPSDDGMCALPRSKSLLSAPQPSPKHVVCILAAKRRELRRKAWRLLGRPQPMGRKSH